MIVTPEQAKDLLQSNQVIAIPTETVYGLAASLHSEKAIQDIFDIKGRPSNNPLIVHVSSRSEIDSFVTKYPPYFDELAQAFWPGPLTVILPAINIPFSVNAGLPTTAFRVPSHPVARKILQMTGPLVIPSANISGKPSSTSVDHVEKDFGNKFPVVDGGKCDNGLESTILIFKDEMWQIARLGAIAAEEFLKALPYVPNTVSHGSIPICPGQYYRHYAPQAKLILDNDFTKASLILGFSDRLYPKTAEVWYLGSSQDSQSVAKTLYKMLRELDSNSKEVAWVDTNFSNEGIWVTIRERILKAALKN